VLINRLGLAKKAVHTINDIKAPMPGLIGSVQVSVGQSLQEGDPVLILEAMKMENVIKSPGDGVIARIHVAEKDSVDKNALLVSFT
jgi:biotin carboxyl carrier protein